MASRCSRHPDVEKGPFGGCWKCKAEAKARKLYRVIRKQKRDGKGGR